MVHGQLLMADGAESVELLRRGRRARRQKLKR